MKIVQTGFNLIEVLVTLALVAIIAAFLAPDMSSFVRDNRMSSVANQFVAAVVYARSESIKRNVPVELVAVDGASADNEWGGGWQIKLEDNTAIRVFPALKAGDTLDADNGAVKVQFTPDGRSDVSENLTLCNSGQTGEKGRRLTLLKTGQISVENHACS